VQAFKPKVVAEVGTYIGKSTLALVSSGATVYTCDHSNDIKLPFKVNQYPMKGSTEMFEDMLKNKIKADLIFLDGRLTPRDIRLMAEIAHGNTVVLLDDFEGVEKGVANAQMFQYEGAMLVYPAEKDLLEKHGLPDESTLAMVVPHSVVRLTSQ
jgi:predicted O-methyltransferase YrrM